MFDTINNEDKCDSRLKRLTTLQRTMPLNLGLDPIFINTRRIQTALGASAISSINGLIAHSVPNKAPSSVSDTQVYHIIMDFMLKLSRKNNFPTLGALLRSGNLQPGQFFCSIENLKRCKIRGKDRIRQEVKNVAKVFPKVVLEYSTDYIVCSSGWGDLSDGDNIGIVGLIDSSDAQQVVIVPLVMGDPWLNAEGVQNIDFDIMWYGSSFYKLYPQDIDAFSKISNTPIDNEWLSVMRNVPEASIKRCFCTLLGQNPIKDWGGEECDIFISTLHLSGKPTTAAFVLKGPAKFSPMTMTHLGKNGDQIYRLAKTPADLLIVQHCHEITPSVHETLRNFAVQPGNPRRYCVIDGQSTYRILKAYNLLSEAVSSMKTPPPRKRRRAS